MAKIKFDEQASKYFYAISRHYWDLRDFLHIARQAKIESRDFNDLLAFHFASQESVNPLHRTPDGRSGSRELANSVSAVNDKSGIEKRLNRYMEQIKSLGINISRDIYNKQYDFDIDDAMLTLDWYFGVGSRQSRYTEEQMKLLIGDLPNIKKRDVWQMISGHNLGVIVNGIFEHFVGEERFADRPDIEEGSSNGVWDLDPLIRFISFFENPELLLPLAYPNAFLPKKHNWGDIDSIPMFHHRNRNGGFKIKMKKGYDIKDISCHIFYSFAIH